MVFLITIRCPPTCKLVREKVKWILTFEGSVMSRVLTFKPCQSPKGDDGSMVWPLFGVLKLLDSNSLMSTRKPWHVLYHWTYLWVLLIACQLDLQQGFFFFLQFRDVKLKLQSSIRLARFEKESKKI